MEKARVLFQVSPCRVYDGWSGSRVGFLRTLRFSVQILIQPNASFSHSSCLAPIMHVSPPPLTFIIRRKIIVLSFFSFFKMAAHFLKERFLCSCCMTLWPYDLKFYRTLIRGKRNTHAIITSYFPRENSYRILDYRITVPYLTLLQIVRSQCHPLYKREHREFQFVLS
jgi:hypothetical protein